jgi:hypothetical protein
MHRGHDHHDHPSNGSGGAQGHASQEHRNQARHTSPAIGHNHAHAPHGVTQWQTPHLGEGHQTHHEQGEPDLDQVEAAFVEGFAAASDPTSFLRLSNVPFEATAVDGTKLVLLRVETNLVTDVGSIMPHLGGASFRYDPLPAAMVTRRRRLRFIYRGEGGIRALSFAEVRALQGG